MTGTERDEPSAIEQEFDLDAPPEAVWRAISVPAVRDRWLPAGALAQGEPTIVEPGRSVSYRMRERDAPFLESTVTFAIAANGCGGTVLRITHKLAEAPALPGRPAVNSNGPFMRAA